MPFLDEIIAIDSASVDSLFQFLLFQAMVIYQANSWFQSDFGLLFVTVHMHMNGLMLIQIEENRNPKVTNKVGIPNIFGKDRYKFLYRSK